MTTARPSRLIRSILACVITAIMWPTLIVTGQESVGTPAVMSAPAAVVPADTEVTTANSTSRLQLPPGSTESTLVVQLDVTNTSSADIVLESIQPTLQAYDRASIAWPITATVLHYLTAPIGPGASFQLEITASNPNQLAYNGPVFLRVGNLLDEDVVVHALLYQDGEVSVPDSPPQNPLRETQNPVSLSGPVEAAPAVLFQQVDQMQGSVIQTTALPATPLNIDAMIPPLADFPEGLWIVIQEKMTREQIAATFTDPGSSDRILNQWGWQENVHIYLEGAPTPKGIAYADIGIHRFDSADSARMAMDYFAADRSAILGQWTIESAPIAEHSQVITNGYDTTTYVVVESVVVRVSVGGSDASDWSFALAQNVYDRGMSQRNEASIAIVQRRIVYLNSALPAI